jgi:AraC-like DNA-binding protein
MADAPAYEMVLRPAPAGLADLVIGLTHYVEIGPMQLLLREQAALVVPLLIGFDAPFAIALGRDPDPSDRYQSFAAGLTMRPALIRSLGQAACIQVNFTPLGARAFFGPRLADMTEQIVPLEDLGDGAITSLRQRLGETPQVAARLGLVEAFVAERLRRASPPAGPIRAAYGAILARDGQLRSGALAAAVGWSRKHFTRRFTAEFGIGPKDVARIARFTAAARMARSAEPPGWAEIAAATGFADQAHLSREFKALSDRSPTDWLHQAAF